MNRLILAALALLCLSLPAEARQRHRHQVTHCVETGTVLQPICGMGGQLNFEPSSKASRREAVRLARGKELYDAMPFGTVAPRAGAAAAFIRGRLICARNINAELAARGIRGTGSAMAKSFLHWGRPSSGQVGDVAVFNRRGGGHVAIVAGFGPNGERLYLNPSARRQAWQVGPYHRQPIAFRSPS
jgi:hypothetical protein